MSDRLQVSVYQKGQRVYAQDFAGAVELGRQDQGEAVPFHETRESDHWRVVIAPGNDDRISRKYLRVERVGDHGVRLRNLSARLPLQTPDGRKLRQGDSCELPLPVALKLGVMEVRLEESEPEEATLQSLAEVTAPPGLASGTQLLFPMPSISPGGERKLIGWMHAVMDVLQSASSAADFFDKAARAAVELIHLDSARVLRLINGQWQSQVLHHSREVATISLSEPSRAVLGRVQQDRKTFWQLPGSPVVAGGSLKGIRAVVAAPILDRQGAVIGALYGDRRGEGALAAVGPITELEASLVELLARGVAAGLARLDQELAALALRVQFEQFFTAELAHQLEQQPNLLEGRYADVTLLFCDIRGFSRISERLEPVRMIAWLRDTMEVLSECVRAHRGVLVDYIADELIAMWGAPQEEPDHACLACRAALDMLGRLPQLNERWQAELQEPMDLGIGLNTGLTRVGNTGSRYKFKYGPLGSSANLASRVQGATKYFRCRLLITKATRDRLDASFLSRRLARVRVVNIDRPVDVYELTAAGHPNWAAARAEYEKALELFEKEQFRAASTVLGSWRLREPDDGPALVLLHRAVQCEVEQPDDFDGVWELPGK